MSNDTEATRDEHGSMCFYCPNPGTYRAWCHVISPVMPWHLSGDYISLTDKPLPNHLRGGMWIEAFACKEHEDGLADGLMHFFGGVTGRSLVKPPPCNHPFHSSEEEQQKWAETVHDDGVYSVTGYRCPACGEGGVSMSQVNESDPAARLVIESLREVIQG